MGNLPIPENKEGLFNKIKSWFKNIFSKKNNNKDKIDNDTTESKFDSIDKNDKDFISNMKKGFNDVSLMSNNENALKKKEALYIKDLIKNREKLYDLSDEQLDAVYQMCQNQIKIKTEILEKLKAN